MKIIQELKVVSALAAAVLICVGCKPEQAVPPASPAATNPPASVAPPATTNAPAPAAVLTPQQAKDHVGEQATVRGQVFGVHVTAKGDVFINIGAAFPDQPFTAVCFQGAIPAEDLQKLDGKTISVKGKIKEHNDQVEIILDTADQISE